MSSHHDNWIGDRFFDGNRDSEHVSMKPLLSALVAEAVRIAIVDSIDFGSQDDARQVAVYRDAYQVTDAEWASIDPNALARNIANRLLGYGNNLVRGHYTGNLSARETFDVVVGNSHENLTDQLLSDLRGALERGDCGE